MCKFHKDVARAISQDPASGSTDNRSGFDPGTYAVALLATKMRLEEYMPEMFGCDGFVPKEMITDDALQSFANSPLVHLTIGDDGKEIPFDRLQISIEQYAEQTLPLLHRAMKTVAEHFDLREEALNLPVGLITEQGFKEKPCHAPDPRQNGAFLDEAVVDLFEGYHPDIPGFSNGELSLLKVAHKSEFEPLRGATDAFLSLPGVEDAIRELFERSVVLIFKRAPQDVANNVGYETSDGCGMCLRQSYHDVSGRLHSDDDTSPSARINDVGDDTTAKLES